jgi:hypothetical protein
MAGLVPAIPRRQTAEKPRAFRKPNHVDGRDKPGHDEKGGSLRPASLLRQGVPIALPENVADRDNPLE